MERLVIAIVIVEVVVYVILVAFIFWKIRQIERRLKKWA